MKLSGSPLHVGALLLTAVVVAGCQAPPAVPYDPPPASLRRLTQAQYVNSIQDVFGSGIVIAGDMEPDVAVADFLSVGAAQTSISQRGTAQYERLAYDIAHQALSGANRAAIVFCQPTAMKDDGCARQVINALGRRLFRRSLTAEESDELTRLAGTAATTLADFYVGLEFAVAALLQSDSFLFRIELGVPDVESPTGGGRFSALEMASRLSFFLWDGPPDEELLITAEQGGLDTPEGLGAQVDRMIASPLARRGLRAFITEALQLYQLDDLIKDPMIFTQASSDLGPAAREETLADFERLVFELDGDLREILTTRETMLNRKLASLYGVRAPSLEDFALTTLPADQPRRGLLGQASVLALQSHPTTTSPTLRGKFVRTILLCHVVPPPPVDLNTGLPDPSPTARTLRERLLAHQTNPACSGCHGQTDVIGLGLENFDGLGVYRTRENSQPIDASGTLDGTAFSGASDLAQALHDHPDFAPCFARRLFRYATGHEETAGEEAFIKSLADGQVADGYRVRALMTAIARSDAFRRTALAGSN